MENIYEQFIANCRSVEEEEINSGIYMERHHVMPRHCGGSDEDSNIIRVSRKNHILAHFYRWIAYDSKPDKVAYYFMVGDPTGEAKREAARMAQKTWTPEKRSNSAKKAYQTMVERSSGIANRGKSWRNNVSLAARGNIALNRTKRMNPKTLTLMKNTFVFRYEDKSVTINQVNFGDFSSTSKHLCSIWGIEVKDSEHKKFIRLVLNQRKVFHGIILDKVISSQDALGTERKVQRLEAESRTDGNASTSALQP